MKKFIISTILFIPLSIILYLFFLILWGDSVPKQIKTNLNYRIGSYGHMFTRLRELHDYQDIDILFLGSSHAYRSFDPRIFQHFGFETFNLGSSGQSPIQTEVLLNRYLDELNPKLIIFEVYPATFSTDGVESSLDIIANDVVGPDTIKLALKQNHLKIYNTLLYALYRDYFNNNSTYKEDIKKNTDTYINGGFVEKEISFNDEQNPIKLSKWIFNEEQFNSLKKITDLLKNKEINLILLQAPLTRIKYNSFTNNSEFDELIKQYGVYLNFNELIDLDDYTDFYDSHHLNQNGVEKFNQRVIDVLFTQEGSLKEIYK